MKGLKNLYLPGPKSIEDLNSEPIVPGSYRL